MTAAHHLEVELYFDILSPFSLFAIETFRHYAVSKKWNVKLDLKPASVLGDIFILYVTSHLTRSKPYNLRRVSRRPRRYPLVPPGFLKNTVVAQSILACPWFNNHKSFPSILHYLSESWRWSERKPPQNVYWDRLGPFSSPTGLRTRTSLERTSSPRCTSNLFVWHETSSFHPYHDIIFNFYILKWMKVLLTAGHKDADIKKLIEAAKSDRAKLILENLTKEAVDRGAFSLPTYTARRLDPKTGKPRAEKQEPMEDSGGISEKAGSIIGEWELFYGAGSWVFPEFSLRFHPNLFGFSIVERRNYVKWVVYNGVEACTDSL